MAILKNIKVKLTKEDEIFIRFRTVDRDISLTAFCTKLVENALDCDSRPTKRDYRNEGKFVNVLLTNDYFKMLQALTAELCLSKREVVYRFIQDYISLERE